MVIHTYDASVSCFAVVFFQEFLSIPINMYCSMPHFLENYTSLKHKKLNKSPKRNREREKSRHGLQI